MSIGETIKARREAIGMTQTKLAAAVGVSVPMICVRLNEERRCPHCPLGRKLLPVWAVNWKIW